MQGGDTIVKNFYRIAVGADTEISAVIAPSAAVHAIRLYRRPDALFRALLRGNCDAAVLRVSPQGAFSPGLTALLMNETPVPIIAQVPESLAPEWIAVFRRLQPGGGVTAHTGARVDLRLLRKCIQSRREVRNPDQAQLDLLARSAFHLARWIRARSAHMTAGTLLRKSLGSVRISILVQPRGGPAVGDGLRGVASRCASLLSLWYPPAAGSSMLPIRPEHFSERCIYLTIPDDRERPLAMAACERDGRWSAALRAVWAALLRAAIADALRTASLQEEANRDPLTGAWNRRGLPDDLRRMAAHARQRDMCLAVAFVDLAALAEVNDRFGYGAGDRHLREFANGMVRGIAPHGRLYRYGGDEFIVAMTASSCRAARRCLAQALEGAVPPLPDGRPAPPARILTRCVWRPSDRVAAALLSDCVSAARRHT